MTSLTEKLLSAELSLVGEVIGEIPSGLYPGAYLKDVGAALAARDDDRYLAQKESEWLTPVRHFAIDAMMAAR